MDSEHRHELKENDLADFLAHFGQWWAKHGTKLLTVVLVLAVAFTGKRWYDMRTVAAKENAWRDLAETTSPEGYRSVALTHPNAAVRALAYLRGADLLLANTAVGDDSDLAETSQTLDSAALMYEQVINDRQTHLVYKLNAQLGLAAVAEGGRDWDAARQHYQSVIDQAGTQYTTIAKQAQARAAMLDRLEKPVVFGPEETEAAPPAAQDDSATTPPAQSTDEPPVETDLSIP